MSGDPKTLTPEAMTLEEAIAEVHKHEWIIHFHHDGFVEIETFSDDDLAYEEGLLPALSFALGVPVVARDEAAEPTEECFCDKCGWAGKATGPDYRHDGCNYGALPVREWKLYAAKKEAGEWSAKYVRCMAAIREWAEATEEAEDYKRDERFPRGAQDAAQRLENAEDWLRRLAGGENEK